MVRHQIGTAAAPITQKSIDDNTNTASVGPSSPTDTFVSAKIVDLKSVEQEEGGATGTQSNGEPEETVKAPAPANETSPALTEAATAVGDSEPSR